MIQLREYSQLSFCMVKIKTMEDFQLPGQSPWNVELSSMENHLQKLLSGFLAAGSGNPGRAM